MCLNIKNMFLSQKGHSLLELIVAVGLLNILVIAHLSLLLDAQADNSLLEVLDHFESCKADIYFYFETGTLRTEQEQLGTHIFLRRSVEPFESMQVIRWQVIKDNNSRCLISFRLLQRFEN